MGGQADHSIALDSRTKFKTVQKVFTDAITALRVEPNERDIEVTTAPNNDGTLTFPDPGEGAFRTFSVRIITDGGADLLVKEPDGTAIGPAAYVGVDMILSARSNGRTYDIIDSSAGT